MIFTKTEHVVKKNTTYKKRNRHSSSEYKERYSHDEVHLVTTIRIFGIPIYRSSIVQPPENPIGKKDYSKVLCENAVKS